MFSPKEVLTTIMSGGGGGVCIDCPLPDALYVSHSLSVQPILSAHLLNTPVAIFLQIHIILHFAGDRTDHFILSCLFKVTILTRSLSIKSPIFFQMVKSPILTKSSNMDQQSNFAPPFIFAGKKTQKFQQVFWRKGICLRLHTT